MIRVGEVIWVDEGDSAGCTEFGGTVEQVNDDGTLEVRVKSHAIGAGAAYDSLRRVDPGVVSICPPPPNFPTAA